MFDLLFYLLARIYLNTCVKVLDTCLQKSMYSKCRPRSNAATCSISSRSALLTITKVTGNAVAQWYSAGLRAEGLQVQASLASPLCVFEQDTLILA